MKNIPQDIKMTFQRTMRCPGKCDLFSSREERRNLESLLGKRISNKGLGVCKTLSDMLIASGAIDENHSVYAVLGQGVYGTVLGLCDTSTPRSSNKYALKIAKYDKDTESEVAMQNKFYDIGFAPKIHKFKLVGKNSYILMDHIDITLDEYLLDPRSIHEVDMIYAEIDSSISVMYSHKLIHGDMHSGNIVLNLKDDGSFDRIGFIDFGFSKFRDDDSIMTLETQFLMEYLQLLRSVDQINSTNSIRVKNTILRKIQSPELKEVLDVFQTGIDLRNDHTTQDDTYALIHEMFYLNELVM
jgi:tRNA A-37 threonylcarbamoyl transferase component Bud32